MTDAMEILFDHAQERLEKSLLLLEPEYETARRHADSQEQRLRAVLSGEETEILESLIDEQNTLSYFHGQAMFCAGFRLAMELSR